MPKSGSVGSPVQAAPQGQKSGDRAILDKPVSGLYVPGATPTYVEPPWVHAQRWREDNGFDDSH